MSNPFAFYGLEPTLNIDAKSLRKQYLNIQRETHPDLVAENPASMDKSELANAYYKGLTDPLTLVKSYLEVKSDSPAIPNSLPADFLMEMMDLSDSIESMDRGNQAAMQGVENDLVAYEKVLESEFYQFQQQVSPDIVRLGEWYQKSKYIGRLRKNFDGIVEI